MLSANRGSLPFTAKPVAPKFAFMDLGQNTRRASPNTDVTLRFEPLHDVLTPKGPLLGPSELKSEAYRTCHWSWKAVGVLQ